MRRGSCLRLPSLLPTCLQCEASLSTVRSQLSAVEAKLAAAAASGSSCTQEASGLKDKLQQASRSQGMWHWHNCVLQICIHKAAMCVVCPRQRWEGHTGPQPSWHQLAAGTHSNW